MNISRFKYFFTLAVSLFTLFGTAQESEGKVYFLGIGVEKCFNGVQGKANAVADVQVVMERTKKDVKTTDNITYVHDGALVTASNFVGYTLFNDNATLENIDTLVNDIAKRAKRHDVIYVYISAMSSGESGGFILPVKSLPSSQKKGKLNAPTSTVLEPLVLSHHLSAIACQNQIIVIDGSAWNENQDEILPAFFEYTGQEKNQIVVIPLVESSDSFAVAGKQVSVLAAVINNASKPILRLLKKNDQATESVKTSLSIAYNNLTQSESPVCAIYNSWKLLKAGTTAEPVVKKDTPNPVTNSEDVSRKSTAAIPDIPSIETATSVRNYALIIANQNYQNSSAWPNLNNPIADANAIKAELETFYNYEVRLCTNLGLDSMLTEINNLHNQGFDQNTQVLFYYAGHGGQKKLGSQAGAGYMVPVDGKAEEDDKNLTSYLSYDILKARLDGLRARHVLAMIDACFSGSADADAFAQEVQDKDNAGQQMMRSSILVQVHESMLKKSRYFICSGKLNPVSDGAKGKLSPFALIFVGALKEGHNGSSAIVYASDIESALYNKLDSRPYAFAFGGTTPSANGFMFVPKALVK